MKIQQLHFVYLNLIEGGHTFGGMEIAFVLERYGLEDAVLEGGVSSEKVTGMTNYEQRRQTAYLTKQCPITPSSS
ncbi:hypothetical protein Scep_023659 [Stephania cephalantha]|uniref:Uncharacterized protein n=1 Tax=Stephania cephalantha TaxID=152367 RepID=A0AAP0HXL5_9MAGN